jgi:co-chaperonin GroES (HSP10)
MIQPLGNNIVVEPITQKEYHGIHIPEDITHKDNPFSDPRTGIVKAVGIGRLTKKGVRIPISLNVGDKVCVPRHSKKPVEIDGVEMWMIDADEIMGVIE